MAPGEAALKPRQRPPGDARRLAGRIAAGATPGLRISAYTNLPKYRPLPSPVSRWIECDQDRP
jgi:hypothetical protein